MLLLHVNIVVIHSRSRPRVLLSHAFVPDSSVRLRGLAAREVARVLDAPVDASVLGSDEARDEDTRGHQAEELDLVDILVERRAVDDVVGGGDDPDGGDDETRGDWRAVDVGRAHRRLLEHSHVCDLVDDGAAHDPEAEDWGKFEDVCDGEEPVGEDDGTEDEEHVRREARPAEEHGVL